MPFRPERIQGYERLTERFGGWPSFHDAEVLRLALDRRGQTDQVELTADVHVHEMTSNVTDDGFYELRNHTLVSLRFEGIAELELSGFNGQNALFGLRIDDISGRQLDALKWAVAFDSSWGVEARFLCRSIAVAEVASYVPPARSGPGQSPPRAEPGI